jgi:uncharacterized protein YbcI
MSDQLEAAARVTGPALVISNHMVRLMVTYVGRGPAEARTTLNSNVALVAFRQTMSRSEHNLVAAGEADAVRTMRQTFHRSMREEAVAGVEAVLDRRVIAFLSDIDTDADIGVVVFVLEPQPALAEMADAEYAAPTEPDGDPRTDPGEFAEG